MRLLACSVAGHCSSRAAAALEEPSGSTTVGAAAENDGPLTLASRAALPLHSCMSSSRANRKKRIPENTVRCRQGKYAGSATIQLSGCLPQAGQHKQTANGRLHATPRWAAPRTRKNSRTAMATQG